MGTWMNRSKTYALILFALFLTACGVPNRATQPKSALTDLVELERKLHDQVNRHRISRNLPPLTTVQLIAEQARAHSRAMARKTVPLGHDGFARRIDRISRSLPYVAAAENIGYNQGYSDSAQRVLQSWLESREHRKSVEGDYRLTGIGVARDSQGAYYFTQIFWK